MKVTNTDQQGDSGLYHVGQQVTDNLNWIFRPQKERDYGIDALVEVVTNNETKGQLLAFQIKSGSSWFNEKTDNGVVFRSDAEHLGYWTNYPLPVVVVLHNPDNNSCYWEVVNDKTIIQTGKGWKIIVPYEQKIEKESKDKLYSFCNFPISGNDFSILSTTDTSHAAAKRYSVSILLNRDFSKGEILQLGMSITNDMSKREYYRNNLLKQKWSQQSAHVVWLFIYLSFEDSKTANWICRTQWIDSNLEETYRPIKMDGVKVGDEFVFDWSQNYEALFNLLKNNSTCKEDYMHEVEEILKPTIRLMDKVIGLVSKYSEKNIVDSEYVKKMTSYAKYLHELYMNAMDISLSPVECKDYSDKFQSVMASADNVILPFTSLWDKQRTTENRDCLIDFHLKQFKSDYQELVYEKKKIT